MNIYDDEVASLINSISEYVRERRRLFEEYRRRSSEEFMKRVAEEPFKYIPYQETDEEKKAQYRMFLYRSF